MKNKKAITLQFHWIFILIAGGIILAFFFSIASKQGDLSDEKLSLSLVHSIDMILELAESSEGTSQVIPLPKKGISASCSSGCDCYFSVSGARSSFGSNVVFSEKDVDSPEAVVWSLPWKVPFRALNVLYLSNPETRKIVVFADDSFDYLKSDFQNIIPDNIFFEYTDLDELRYDGSERTKILVFKSSDSPITLPSSFDNAAVDVLIVSNKINFFKKSANSKDLNFVAAVNYPADVVWILGAFFSADKDSFVCGMKSALRRLNNVAKIFYNRASDLEKVISAPPFELYCTYPLEDIDALIEKTSNVKDIVLFNVINDINFVKDDLKLKNNQLIQESCPELF